jgi:NCAIR mutase (PurE)-related protein
MLSPFWGHLPYVTLADEAAYISGSSVTFAYDVGGHGVFRHFGVRVTSAAKAYSHGGW